MTYLPFILTSRDQIILHYYQSQSAAEESASSIRTLDVQVFAVQADASHPDFGTKIITAATSAFPSRTIDILVNTAAVAHYSEDSASFSIEDFDTVFHANVRGPALLIQAALPHLTSPGARIINIGSIVARTSANVGNLYAGSKAALTAMTPGWAYDLAPKGITANMVVPGPVATDSVGPEDQPLMVRTRAMQMITRNGEPREVEEVVGFLAGDGSSFVTGQIWNVDGGVH